MRLTNRDTPDTYRYRYFGGFRLLLASLVMVQHFGADLAPLPLAQFLQPYAVGSMAVLAFFALSGFVITEAIDRVYRDRPGSFICNRLLRLVPHFLLAVALSILALAFFAWIGGTRLWRSQPSIPDLAFDPANMALNFAGILPGVDRLIHYNFLDIAWAIRIEMAFYLIMAVCIVGGRRAKKTLGFAPAAAAIAILLIPAFVLSVLGRGIGLFAFLPHFVFGAGLYFATRGSRFGWLAFALSLPAIFWHCIESNATITAPGLTPPSAAANLIILIVLLTGLTALAFMQPGLSRTMDQRLGTLTYPLYLYHEDVLVLILAMTVDYTYTALIVGVAASVLLAASLTALIDPLVDHYRDAVRGRPLHRRTAARTETPQLAVQSKSAISAT